MDDYIPFISQWSRSYHRSPKFAGYDGNDYFVYDDSVVTITTGQGDYKVNELDASDSDDGAIIDAIKPTVADMTLEKDAVDGDLLLNIVLLN